MRAVASHGVTTGRRSPSESRDVDDSVTWRTPEALSKVNERVGTTTESGGDGEEKAGRAGLSGTELAVVLAASASVIAGLLAVAVAATWVRHRQHAGGVYR